MLRPCTGDGLGIIPLTLPKGGRRWQRLKEIGYTEKKMQQGYLFIHTHSKLYVVQSLRRVAHFRTGVWSFSRRYLAPAAIKSWRSGAEQKLVQRVHT
jgi:hypothetical protein